MKNKAFFFDIDSTLVYEKKKLFVSEKNIQAIKKISENEAIKLS